MKAQSIWRPQDLFPLSHEPDKAALATSVPVGSCRPYGLRYLVDPDPSATSDVDLTTVRFDDASQIAVMGDEFGGIPAFKHTSGKTKTTTNVQDRETSDSDTDYEQD